MYIPTKSKERCSETKNKITLFSEFYVSWDSEWRPHKQTKLLLCTPELQSFVVITAVVEARFESGFKAEYDSSVWENLRSPTGLVKTEFDSAWIIFNPARVAGQVGVYTPYTYPSIWICKPDGQFRAIYILWSLLVTRSVKILETWSFLWYGWTPTGHTGKTRNVVSRIWKHAWYTCICP